MNKPFLHIKYPKLLVLLLTFVIAYLLFSGREDLPFHTFLLSLGYLGTFLAGVFFAYGFTAAPATAMLLILSKEQNLVLAGFLGGFGALIGDLIIFTWVKHTFAEEFERLSEETMVHQLNHNIPKLLKKYLVPILAGFIIASPLPDEIGISMLAASRSVSTKLFSIISYVLNTAGIFVILLIGSSLGA